MSLQNQKAAYDAWLTRVQQQVRGALEQARSQLAAAQGRPDADERIAKAEALVEAKVEALLLELEGDLEPIREALAAHFERTEEPSEADLAFQERVQAGVDPVREQQQRKLRSLIAQAQAEELTAGPAAAGAPAGAAPSKFCPHCGEKL